MMDVVKVVEKLRADAKFQEWQVANKKSFLYIVFAIRADPQTWEIGFCNPKDNTAKTFIVGDTVDDVAEESKIFKPADEKVDELRLDKVTINVDRALGIVEAVRVTDYPQEQANKTIIILQQLKKPLWNVTLLTSSLNVLNVKIDARSGDVLEKSLVPALSFNSAKQKAS
ncbi:MAG: hypothetical protein Q7R56_03415 [Nanoarchaeota archaeon]|nr:hypothetical protein [Nanoarchaeota archaeon]